MTLGVSLVTAGFVGPHRFTTTLFSEAGQPEKGFLSVGIIYTVSTLGSLIAAPLISRFGVKQIFFWSSLLYGFYVLFLQVSSIGLLFFISGLLGLASALFWNAQSIYMVEYSQADRRGQSSGFFHSIYSALALAGVISFGYLLGQSALTRFQILVLFSIFSFLGSLIIAFLPRRVFVRVSLKNQLDKIINLAKNRMIIPLLVVWGVSGFIAGISIGILPLLLKGRWSPAVVGVWISLFWAAPILFSYVSGALSDKIGTKGVAKIGLWLTAIGALGLLSSTSWILAVSSFLLPLGYAGIRTVSYVQLGELTTNSTLLELNALLWISTTAGALIPIFLGGFGLIQLSVVGLIIITFVSWILTGRNFEPLKSSK